jgi:hypothetical protein
MPGTALHVLCTQVLPPTPAALPEGCHHDVLLPVKPTPIAKTRSISLDRLSVTHSEPSALYGGQVFTWVVRVCATGLVLVVMEGCWVSTPFPQIPDA